MPVLFEILGLLLLGAGVYLFLSARDTAAENRRLAERLLTQDDLLRGFETRLRYLESRNCGEEPAGEMNAGAVRPAALLPPADLQRPPAGEAKR